MGFVFVPLESRRRSRPCPRFLRTDGTALMNLVRNIGSAIGVSVTTTVLADSVQMIHSQLVRISRRPFNRALGVNAPSMMMNPQMPFGLANLNGLIETRSRGRRPIQNDFLFMFYICLPAIVIVWLMQASAIRGRRCSQTRGHGMTMRVAFLGLGVMGYPMAGPSQARRSRRHRLQPHDRTRPAAGRANMAAQRCDAGGSRGRDADIVMACVGRDADLRSVTLGRERRVRSDEEGRRVRRSHDGVGRRSRANLRRQRDGAASALSMRRFRAASRARRTVSSPSCAAAARRTMPRPSP